MQAGLDTDVEPGLISGPMDDNTPLPVKQIARELGLAKSTVHLWITQGWLQAEKRYTLNRQGFYYVTTLAAVDAANRQRQAARALKPGRRPKKDVDSTG